MILVCHMISQNHIIKRVMLGGYRHYGSEDIMFLVVKSKILHALTLSRNYCLSLKDMACKHMAYRTNNSDPGHTRLKQQLKKKQKEK